MPELWESLGQYSLRSYTKVDIWESDNRFSIETNAIHEYAHAYMIKKSNYGSYLMCMIQIVKNHSDQVYTYHGNQRDEFRRKIQKLEKVFYVLHDNMKVVQETIASLVEILYVCYARGYNEGVKHLWKMGSYLEYVKKFDYIIDKSFLENVRQQYLEYLKNKDAARYNVLYRIKDDNPEIFIGILMLLDIGILALNINQLDCNVRQWASPNAFVNIANRFEYNPDKRFDAITKKVLARDCTMWDVSFLEKLEHQVDLDIIKEQIISLIDFSYVHEDDSTIRSQDSNMLDVLLNVPDGIVSMKDFISFAFLTAMPSITCQNSVDKFYKSDEYVIPYSPKEDDKRLCNEYLQRAGTIGVKYSLSDRDCFHLWIDQRLENDESVFAKENARWNIGGRIRFWTKDDNLLDVLPSLLDKNIILYGNYGFERVIKRLNALGKKHYVFLTNNLKLLYEFICTLVRNNKGKTNATFIKSTDCKDILVVKCQNTIVFQPMINRYIETIQKDYGLVFGHNIIDQETESMIKRIIHCYYEDEAHFVSHSKDNYTYISSD